MKEELVFISGSVEGYRDKKYEFISKSFKRNGYLVWTSNDIDRVTDEEKDIYNNTNIVISNSKLVIVDISENLVNQGIVLQIAHENNIPVYLLIKNSLSSKIDLIYGMENIRGKAFYKEFPIEVESEIEGFINSGNKVKQYL